MSVERLCECGHAWDKHKRREHPGRICTVVIEEGNSGLHYNCGCPDFKAIGQSDQPAPTINDSVPVVDQINGFLERRKQFGIEKYGTPLQAGNGRDALVDAFEEAADLFIYLGQVIIERDGHLPGGEPESPDVSELRDTLVREWRKTVHNNPYIGLRFEKFCERFIEWCAAVDSHDNGDTELRKKLPEAQG